MATFKRVRPTLSRRFGMKLKERDRSEVYDQLYDLAARILVRMDACSTCPIGTSCKANTRSWCCGGCKHLGPQGCTVKSLSCKLWLCTKEHGRQDLELHHNYLRDRLYKLTTIARYYNLYVLRGSKEQALEFGGINELAVYYDR